MRAVLYNRNETMLPAPLHKILLTAFIVLAAAGCGNEVDPDSPEGKRQAIFKKMLNHSEPMAGMLGDRLPYDAETFAAHAQRLQALSSKPWDHFPEPGDNPQRTAAEPAVWADPLGFALRASDFETAATLLALKAGEGVDDPEMLREPFQAVQQACKACHDDYRR
jgi:cytochrome c556